MYRPPSAPTLAARRRERKGKPAAGSPRPGVRLRREYFYQGEGLSVPHRPGGTGGSADDRPRRRGRRRGPAAPFSIFLAEILPPEAHAGQERSPLPALPRAAAPTYMAAMLDRTANTPPLPPEVARRRTFAIIAHPDAGKTTLTEKFLLYGGAIQMAGQVRAKGEARRTRSDYMKMEQDRGISVSASAMSFPFRDWWFNLVDTPGHSDFSEDTYRTLTAVDAAVMVIDGAKGVESQTRKLFEVCRMRDLPILTFCNKMDREARDTFEIIDEIQQELQLDVCPASWPIGQGRDFLGCYDMLNDRLELMDRADRNKRAESVSDAGPRRPAHGRAHPAPTCSPSCARRSTMARELLPAFDHQAMLDGNLSPIWFGSAINSFGVQELMAGIGALRPAARDPRRRTARGRRLGDRRSPASSSRSRPTWTPSTATASPSSVSARATSSAA